MTKRVLSLLLTALLVLNFVPLSVSAFAAETWTEIGTAADLQKLMKKEGGFADWAGNYKLMADIDLSSITAQTPIGNGATPFSGKFDGQNHKITGLKLTATDDNGTGLFGLITTATLMNVTVEGTVTGEANMFLGGLAGNLKPTAVGECLIENCTSRVTVRGKAYCGGILGLGYLNADAYETFTTTIRNCTNAGNVSAVTQRAGGITDALSPKEGRSVKVIGCKNTGTISVGYNQAGGIVGNCDCPGEKLIQRCVNEGTVKHVTEEGATPQGVIGGIVGCSGANTTIDQCLNKGKISNEVNGSAYTGGIVGHMDEDAVIQDCLNVGEIVDVTGDSLGGICGSAIQKSSTIIRCLNKGTLKPAGDTKKTSATIGDILGHDFVNLAVQDCFYLYEIGAAVHNNGIAATAYTVDGFAKLNAKKAWTNEASPVLDALEGKQPGSDPGKNPSSGDNTVLLVSLAALSVLALGAVVVFSKKTAK